MKVTLKDIAEDTGYSISTVSRVLNGFDMNPSTKEEVIKSARKLNYPIQNYLDNITEIEDTPEILLVSGIELGEFYASFFDGINKAASHENVRLSLSSLDNQMPKVQAIADKIDEGGFDGLIINVPQFSKNHHKKLKKALPEGFPVVSNQMLDTQLFDYVGFDNYGAGQLVAQHFAEKDYLNCGIILGPKNKKVSRQRAHGFRDYIAYNDDMGLSWSFEGDFMFDSGVEAFKAFEKQSDKPRAIFACNDNMCQAFMQEAMVEGYSFPDDIAIVGFDDLPVCSRHRPKISSVHTSYDDLGVISIKKLKELIDNPDQPRSVMSLVATKLIKRESSS